MRHLIFISVVFVFLGCSGDNVPPEIKILTPSTGSTVSEEVEITVMSSDKNGIKMVELWVDGVTAGNTDDTKPFLIKWDTESYKGISEHTLIVRSHDKKGNMKDSAPVLLVVDNTDYTQIRTVVGKTLSPDEFVLIPIKNDASDFEAIHKGHQSYSRDSSDPNGVIYNCNHGMFVFRKSFFYKSFFYHVPAVGIGWGGCVMGFDHFDHMLEMLKFQRSLLGKCDREITLTEASLRNEWYYGDFKYVIISDVDKLKLTDGIAYIGD